MSIENESRSELKAEREDNGLQVLRDDAYVELDMARGGHGGGHGGEHGGRGGRPGGAGRGGEYPTNSGPIICPAGQMIGHESL